MNCNAEMCADLVGSRLRANYGMERYAPYRLGQRIRSTPKAVQNWYYSVTAPRMHELLKLMAECEALEDDVRRLVAELRSSNP